MTTNNFDTILGIITEEDPFRTRDYLKLSSEAFHAYFEKHPDAYEEDFGEYVSAAIDLDRDDADEIVRFINGALELRLQLRLRGLDIWIVPEGATQVTRKEKVIDYSHFYSQGWEDA